MFEGKYGKALTVGLIIGIVAIIGVIGFFTFDYIKNSNINADASDAVDKFAGEVENKNEQSSETNIIEDVTVNIQVENIIINTVTNSDNSNDSTNTYKGFPMVGTIEIPKISLKYPVLGDSSDDAIEVSVAVDSGPGLNKVGNTTIVGHNYRNGTFFSDLKNVSNGDKVYITDLSGTKVEYTVYNVLIVAPEDSDYMDRDTNGKREITLKTCTDDTQSRLLVYARED